MQQIYRITLLLSLILYVSHSTSYAQKISSKRFKHIADSIQSYMDPLAEVKGNITIKSVYKSGKTIKITFNNSLSEYPFREEAVNQIYKIAKRNLPKEYAKNRVQIYSNETTIDQYIPPFYKHNRSTDHNIKNRNKTQLIKKISQPYNITNGLQNRHLAIMQSHGYYYNNDNQRWIWQRARLNETVEDLYTSSYVLQFLVPMLENAGANVFMPRERDLSHNEILIDNDIENSGYTETNGMAAWQSGTKPGFSNPKKYYISGENPFQMGTARIASTISSGDESIARWIPNISESGDYGVYISYQTYPNSSKNAKYTVIHTGGTTHFTIDQTMGGGTWIYLGRFNFESGISPQGAIILSNRSDQVGKIVSADGVKIGGGVGNIARFKSCQSPFFKNRNKNRKDEKISDEDKKIQFTLPDSITPVTSGYPRFAEGARYWLQWAGYADSIYTPNANMNDYNDDFMCRGLWINELNKKIPIDMALAFHTDAGVTPNDSIIGTLGIYRSISEDSKIYPNGESRLTSRYMTDIIQTQIVEDIRLLYEKRWSRRGMWDKSYHEARTPNVPTMLLELLSHQNFADMRYGLDPAFRFHVSRAVYKGILKYLSFKEGKSYIVQPLPVKQFSAILDKNSVHLKWQPVKDTLEETADVKQYLLYTRRGNSGFDNGILLSTNSHSLPIKPGTIYSFKVSAINSGGESFPSEILSVYKAEKEQGEALIVNNFTTISPPKSFAVDTLVAGFIDSIDTGVPYIENISYTGRQYEFRRGIPWVSDENPGFGASLGEYETQIIAGNSFDYPTVHGQAFANSGYSFSSCSALAFSNTNLPLSRFNILDIILGKQRISVNRDSISRILDQIEEYSNFGGNILISGAYIDDSLFTDNLLGCQTSQIYGITSGIVGDYSFANKPNSHVYSVESCTELIPKDDQSKIILRYRDDERVAGLFFSGKYKAVTLGFPIETLSDQNQINRLISELLLLFNR